MTPSTHVPDRRTQPGRVLSYAPDLLGRPLRRLTREVPVGNVGIGGTNPVRVQSMTTTRTQDVAATTAQAIRLVEAGCEIVRITAPTPADARAIGEVRSRLRARGIVVPLVADIHFSPAAALAAVPFVDKVRVNPGNFADSRKFAVREYTDREYEAELERIAQRFSPLVLACKERGVAMRIGTNHGSLSDRVMNRFGDSPEGMVESALEFVRICESLDYQAIVLSMKASNPKIMIAAYRLLVARMNEEGMAYPLHLGVTEAGNGDDARIKSATGIGSLLLDGLGDTIRVSLAEEPEEEIPVARRIVALCAQALPAQPDSLGPDTEVSGGDAPRAEKAALPWDPFSYSRRATRAVRLGALEIGGEATIAVAGLAPGREPSPLPLLNGVPMRGGKRPDVLVLDLQDDVDLEHLARLAWKGDGPAPRPLVARSARPDLLRRAAAHAEGLCALIEGSALLGADMAAAPSEGHVADLAALGRPVWLSIDAGAVAFDDYPALAQAATRLLRHFEGAGLRDLLVSLRGVAATGAVRANRTLVAHLTAAGLDVPLALEAPAGEEPMLTGAAAVGSLLCDGMGDALLAAPVRLAFDLLQGAGARLTRTDYVACPSCGRTLFDLQTTTERIKARTAHLKGVKIAIMGCVVNGPGEMADADFGYMGGSPGMVNLYVGKEPVERGVPEAEADERLIALIKAHGRWVEPGQEEDE